MAVPGARSVSGKRSSLQIRSTGNSRVDSSIGPPRNQTRTWAGTHLHCRPDVLIQTKEIRGIVLFLYRSQAWVIRSVSRLNPVASLFPQIVGVHAASREWSHCFPEVTRPAHVHVIISRIVPDRNRKAVVKGIPVAIRALSSGHAPDCAPDLLEYDKRLLWCSSVAREQHVDRSIRDFAHELRLPKIATAPREQTVPGRLNLYVCNSGNSIFDRVPV